MSDKKDYFVGNGVSLILTANIIVSYPSDAKSIIRCELNWKTGSTIYQSDQYSQFNSKEPVYTAGALIYLLLIIVYSYFYTGIIFNAIEVAHDRRIYSSNTKEHVYKYPCCSDDRHCRGSSIQGN